MTKGTEVQAIRGYTYAENERCHRSYNSSKKVIVKAVIEEELYACRTSFDNSCNVIICFQRHAVWIVWNKQRRLEISGKISNSLIDSNKL